MTHIYLAIINFLDRNEEGQGLAEYALILSLIAVLAVAALTFLGSQLNQIISDIGAAVAAAAS